MSDPYQGFQAPPPPTVEVEPERKRPTSLMWAGVALVIIGIIIVVCGITSLIYGGIGTGLALAALGCLFFAFSFMRLPYDPDPPAPMSTAGTLAGIFYEPANVFRNLRAFPKWLVAILVMGILSAAYVFAFTNRLTPERIVNYTMDKLEESPIKPPPDRMAIARQQALESAKLPTARVGNVLKTIVAGYFGMAFLAALYLLGVLAFGGRMHYWQSLSVAAYAAFPVVIITKVISFIILFVKSPDDIHPIIGQETLVTDNLGILFKAAEHPVFYVAASAIGVTVNCRLCCLDSLPS